MIRERERWCAKVFQNHERKRRRLNWKKKKVFPAKRPPRFPWRSDTLQLQRSGRLQIYYTHAALSSTLLLRRCPVLGSRPPVNTEGLGEHRILSTLRIKSSTLSGCVCVAMGPLLLRRCHKSFHSPQGVLASAETCILRHTRGSQTSSLKAARG